MQKKKKIKSFSRVHVPHKREIRKFHIVVVQQLQRNVQKSAKLLFCSSKPSVFLSFSLPSL